VTQTNLLMFFIGSGGLSINPKKKIFFKKPIQSIFLLTKNEKPEKKLGKYLKLAETAREAYVCELFNRFIF
jgi:hypothetical protein